MSMKKFENTITMAGILVKHTLEEATYGTNNDIECIRGEVIIRTADEGEHPVRFFANKYKKDANGNFTSEENKIYKSLSTVMNEYRTLEEYPDDPDYVEITSASFGVMDYVSKNTNELVTINTISSNFINRITKEKYEASSPTATFEVAGVIASIKDEIIKETPTGNLIVIMNVINQIKKGNGKDATFDVKDMFPLRLTIPADLADTFRSMYSEGVFTKVCGDVINRTETTTKTEKAAFGKDIVKTFTNTVRKNEVTSGVAPVDIYSVGLTDEICSQLISRRNATIAEVKNGKKNSSSSNTTTENTVSASTSNPFASKNPFAK